MTFRCFPISEDSCGQAFDIVLILGWCYFYRVRAADVRSRCGKSRCHPHLLIAAGPNPISMSRDCVPGRRIGFILIRRMTTSQRKRTISKRSTSKNDTSRWAFPRAGEDLQGHRQEQRLQLLLRSMSSADLISCLALGFRRRGMDFRTSRATSSFLSNTRRAERGWQRNCLVGERNWRDRMPVISRNADPGSPSGVASA